MLKDWPEKVLEKNDSTRDLVLKNNGLEVLLLRVRVKILHFQKVLIQTYTNRDSL